MAIFNQWDHSSELLGRVPADGAFKRLTLGDVRLQDIDDANPLYPGGGKYYHTLLKWTRKEKYNAERRPRLVPEESKFENKGGGQFWNDRSYWYGWWMRQDQTDGVNGHIAQWHNNPGHHGVSPPLSIDSTDKGVRIRLEANRDNLDSGGKAHNVKSGLLLEEADWIGVSHRWVLEVRWDTRNRSEGSRGIVRCWIDGQLKFEWLNKSNCHAIEVHDGRDRMPYFKWGMYKTNYNWGSATPNGAETEQSYDLLTYGDDSETIASMMAALEHGGIGLPQPDPVPVPDPEPDPDETPEPPHPEEPEPEPDPTPEPVPEPHDHSALQMQVGNLEARINLLVESHGLLRLRVKRLEDKIAAIRAALG